MPPDEVPHEITLLDKAFEAAESELSREREELSHRAGSDMGDILGFHQRWLADPKPRKEIAALVETKFYSAAYAISVFMRRYRRRFQ